jgi:purine-binding chemotaxis protein CheW
MCGKSSIIRSRFALPAAPDHFLGLIDVRGQGVPTIDLRLRLGLPGAEPTPLTRILILEVPREGEKGRCCWAW